MKKKLIALLLTIPFVAVMNVNAEKVTADYINYDYNLGNITLTHRNEGHTKQYIDINGLTKANLEETNVTWKLYFTKKGNDVLFERNGQGIYSIKGNVNHTLEDDTADEYFYWNLSEVNSDNVVTSYAGSSSYWFYNENYNNFYLIKSVRDASTGNYTHYISKSMSVTRDEFPNGSRYQFLIKDKNNSSGTQGSLYVTMPYGQTGLEWKIKVVKINDMNILKKFGNKDSDAYDNLVSYIKSNEGETFTSRQTSSGKNYDTSSLDFDPNSYYGVYVYYENDGSLLDYSDAYVTKTNSSEDQQSLSIFTDFTEFADSNLATSNTSTVVKNPKTGVEDMIWVAPIILAVAGGFIFIVKRKSSFKAI